MRQIVPIYSDFDDWLLDFKTAAAVRELTPDPDWTVGAKLPAAVWSSIARFQIGESGDGANLIGKARGEGDETYTTAVELFIAEEQNHARLLGLLMGSAG